MVHFAFSTSEHLIQWYNNDLIRVFKCNSDSEANVQSKLVFRTFTQVKSDCKFDFI